MESYGPSSTTYRRFPYCGCYVNVDSSLRFLPRLKVDAHTTILSTTSRTTLTQLFINPHKDKVIDELRYDFPLYDGVSVVGFTCTVADRVITGVVKEREKARQEYTEAKDRGDTAGLLEQSLDAADVFTTSIGMVPAGEKVKVEITYLGELKHDAEVDGVRFTIPTIIAPRYGLTHSLRSKSANWYKHEGISITVDAEMPDGSAIKSVQSPSHPLSVHIGTTSTAAASEEPSLRKASATLSQGSAELNKDFIVHVVATKIGEPSAFVETHPTIPNQRAIMATVVPKFKLPAQKPEIVFLCDRSGSMTANITDLIAALNIFLKSLPLGVKFNICSFGSHYSFLWPKSKTYSQESVDRAVRHVKTFAADYGGTEMYEPFKAAFEQRYKDMNLEVFLLTDGAIWDQDRLFSLVNEKVAESKGAVRVFSLGVGSGASTALIEGVARAGNGFAQTVGNGEKMDKKVIRMLKGALFPHITDYRLEIKYEKEKLNEETKESEEDDFEVVEKVLDSLSIQTAVEEEEADQRMEKEKEGEKQSISLFDPNIDDDGDNQMPDAPAAVDIKYDHLPKIETPRYLQTPSEIPALYPFSRTTVYVLLSDSTPDRKIKSVLLKGTSKQGPLVLEIPVVNLTEKSTTIHQLAARKEVKELEEGRGWLAFARDADGTLFREKHEGYFPDMVEKEAVRLGVKFQVGGKWCSFVAVEESNHGDEKNTEKELDEFAVLNAQNILNRDFGSNNLPESSRGFTSKTGGSGSARLRYRAINTVGNMFGSVGSAFRSRSSNDSGSSLFGSSSPIPLPPPPPAPCTPMFGSHAPSAVLAPQPTGGIFMAPSPYTAPGGAFGAAAPATGGGVAPPPLGGQGLFGNSLCSSRPGNRSASGFGSSHPPPPPPSGTLFGGGGGSLTFGSPPPPPVAEACAAMPDPGLMAQYQAEMSAAACMALPDEDSDDERSGVEVKKKETGKRDREWGYARSSGRRSTSKNASPFAPTSPRIDTSNPLQALTALQTFVGSWSWSITLQTVLGVTSKAASRLTLPDIVANHADKDVIVATACAVVFFKKKLEAEREAWEMLVDKAEAWLDDQVGESREDLENAIGSLY